ncbi:glycosyltransferase family 2 protein [Acidicapsa acidisoli]|uniref:glycosyltransferase family 2 protein n=1 Tax=Acidicapsa acidisoli TaxID=1615681 RepID=UPI0021E04147|nr:glycosyltransferase family 2 protein [Acidicapsa acidisoli]
MTPEDSSSYPFDLSLIIVSFNTREVLRESLQSVARERGDLRLEIFVVDNNSHDGSVAMVESEFPEAQVLRSEVNLGFGSANNLALERAQGRFLVLLNSDAFLHPRSLQLALQHMQENPETGLAGGRLVGRDSELQPSARMLPTILSDFLVMSGLAHKYSKSRFFGRFDRTWADPMQPAEVGWVPGAFSIIRPEALRKVGLFDPDFFLYSEEVDLCKRIQNAGYKIMYWPDIVVTHIGGESSRQIKTLAMSSSGAQLIRWSMRSTLLYYRKHHGAKVWLVKMLELTLFRLTSLRNSISSDPQRKERAQVSRNMVRLMQQAWKDTNGGRVSPPRPWSFD